MNLAWEPKQSNVGALLPDGARLLLFHRTISPGVMPDWHWWVMSRDSLILVSGELPGDMPLALVQSKLEAWAARQYPLHALAQLGELP